MMKELIEKIVVTPEKAKVLLNSNKRNRALNINRIKIYTEQMKKGLWTLCYDPIAVRKDGSIANGQHRLHAVILADMPIEMYIAYNVDDNTVFDKGFVRNTGDSLFMRGVIDEKLSSPSIVSIARFYLSLCPKYRNHVLDDEIADLLLKYGEEICEIFEISHFHERHTHHVCRNMKAQAAMLSAYFNGVPMDVLRRFAQIANTGFSKDERDSAAILYRNYYLNGQKKTRPDIFYFCQNAIADFAKGNPRQRAYSKPQNIYKNIAIEEDNA